MSKPATCSICGDRIRVGFARPANKMLCQYCQEVSELARQTAGQRRSKHKHLEMAMTNSFADQKLDSSFWLG